MHQRITIIGRLGGEVELRYTPAGKEVASFNVATDYTYKKGDEKVKETTWFKVTVWGKNATNCHTYLSKGLLVNVEGRIKAHAYMKDDEPRASLELNADKVLFLERGNPREESEDDPDFMQD